MGTPRESFVSEFLRDHLSERVAVGTGEVIDANSSPGQRRNQHDIVIYKRDFPKLDFGGEISGFLAESVVATIEVKSTLTDSEFQKAALAARNIKSLKRPRGGGLFSGYQPPSILSYIVAYDGPANMSTVHGWIAPFAKKEGVSDPVMGNTLSERAQIAAPCLDGVFVLGKGFLTYDNSAVSLVTDDLRAENPHVRWVVCDSPEGNLLMLFLLLTNAVSGVAAAPFDAIPYVQSAKWPSCKLMP
jgi:hypothetical protein